MFHIAPVFGKHSDTLCQRNRLTPIRSNETVYTIPVKQIPLVSLNDLRIRSATCWANIMKAVSSVRWFGPVLAVHV